MAPHRARECASVRSAAAADKLLTVDHTSAFRSGSARDSHRREGIGTWRNRRVGTPGSDRPARVGSRGNRDRRRAKPDSGSRLPAGGAGPGYSAETAREIGHQNLINLDITAALEKARAHPPGHQEPRIDDG